MRVKLTRKNANGLNLSPTAMGLLNYNYDARGPDNNKDYSKNAFALGTECSVYAMKIRAGITSFYVIEKKYNTITHLPAVCFDIIDPRVSRYWHIRRTLHPEKRGLINIDAFEYIVFAVYEWIHEPRFLEYLVDDREREISIMQSWIKLMDKEFEID